MSSLGTPLEEGPIGVYSPDPQHFLPFAKESLDAICTLSPKHSPSVSSPPCPLHVNDGFPNDPIPLLNLPNCQVKIAIKTTRTIRAITAIIIT